MKLYIITDLYQNEYNSVFLPLFLLLRYDFVYVNGIEKKNLFEYGVHVRNDVVDGSLLPMLRRTYFPIRVNYKLKIKNVKQFFLCFLFLQF